MFPPIASVLQDAERQAGSMDRDDGDDGRPS